MKGKLILLIGPSGSGKCTLINHIRPLVSELVYPKSCTTRAMRPEEKTGEHYFFLTVKDFQERVPGGDFLEYAEYGGNYYGTLASEVLPLLEKGKVALKELEVQGARQIREKIPRGELVIVFVNAGTWERIRWVKLKKHGRSLRRSSRSLIPNSGWNVLAAPALSQRYSVEIVQGLSVGVALGLHFISLSRIV